MDQDVIERIRRLYQGPVGSLWDRIEREQPRSYLEENVVLGRRQTTELVLRWMTGVAGRRILDAGCGRGALAARLAGEGAEVLGVDLLPRFALPGPDRGRSGNPRFHHGDVHTLLLGDRDSPRFDDVVIQEVLEDYAESQRFELLEALCGGSARRIYVIFRVTSAWTRWFRYSGPEGLAATIEPVPFFRWVHLNTGYRLSRQELVSRRNYQVQVTELTRVGGSACGEREEVEVA